MSQRVSRLVKSLKLITVTKSCDGAAANVVVSEAALSRYGLKPLARVVSYHVVAVEPTIMGVLLWACSGFWY